MDAHNRRARTSAGRHGANIRPGLFAAVLAFGDTAKFAKQRLMKPDRFPLIDEIDSNIVLRHARGSPPVELDALSHDLRLPVLREPMDGIAGKLERHSGSPRGFQIVINSRDAVARQRFTHAHKIAHFVLHRDLLAEGLVDSALYRSSLSDEHERQAIRYTLSILLHAEPIRAQYRKDKTYAGLANLFGVSMEAIRARLKELGYG